MLRPEELRELSQPAPLRSLTAIALDWLLIAAGFLLAARISHPISWFLAFIFIARQQLALAIVMHDGAHRRLFKSNLINDLVCQFFCAAPLFFSMYSYQRLHLKHHREPLAPDDPDLSLIGGYPISRVSFMRKIARDAFGISYFKFIRYFIHMARRPKRDASTKAESEHNMTKSNLSGNRLPFAIVILSALVANGVLFTTLFLTGHGWHYLFFWVLPATTALQVLLRVRGIAEHAGYAANPDQSRNARTVINPFQTFLFAPHNVNYHIEHHLYPSVPFSRLPRVHDLLAARGAIPASNVYRGYGQVLSELIK